MQTVSALLVALLVAASLALGTIAVIQNGQQQRIACRQVNVLRSALGQILVSAERSAPSSPYFKKNPALLRAAEQGYASDIIKLGPVGC